MKRNACQKCVFAVRDDNPHCGLRGFTSSFNVEWCEAENDKAPNGYELQEDGYFSWVDKKKEYPKTYEECCKVLDIQSDWHLTFELNNPTSCDLCVNNEFDYVYRLEAFRKLLICRDAYWKIAGEEMGLETPWEPDYTNTGEKKFAIWFDFGEIKTGGAFTTTQMLLSFPTEEMRDAFYENFKSEIESVKELL